MCIRDRVYAPTRAFIPKAVLTWVYDTARTCIPKEVMTWWYAATRILLPRAVLSWGYMGLHAQGSTDLRVCYCIESAHAQADSTQAYGRWSAALYIPNTSRELAGFPALSCYLLDPFSIPTGV
eukprot:304968-Rhodomonas_salina.1